MEWLENPDYAELNRGAPRDNIRTERTLVLCGETIGPNQFHLWATVNGAGDLVISGQDLGPQVQEIFGDSDYEWSHTVPCAHVPAILEMLGGVPGAAALTVLEGYVGKRSYGIGAVLTEASKVMPIEFWSWA